MGNTSTPFCDDFEEVEDETSRIGNKTSDREVSGEGLLEGNRLGVDMVFLSCVSLSFFLYAIVSLIRMKEHIDNRRVRLM